MPLKSKTVERLKAIIEEAREGGANPLEADDIEKGLDQLLEEEIGKALAPLEAKMTARMDQLLRPVNLNPDNSKRVKGLTAARALRAWALTGGDRKEAIAWAKSRWGDDEPALVCLGMTEKTLIEGGNASGGFLVSGDPAGELIELLRPRSVLRALGPQVITMNSDSKPVPRIAGGSTAGYIGENQPDQASDLTFQQLVLRVKKLRATVAISNELNDDADGSTDQMVISDIVESMAVTEDVNFLRGNGLSDGPRGLRYWANAANITASNAADDGTDPTLAEVRADISEMINALTDNNTRMIKPVWIMSNRSATFMKWNLVDGNNNLVFGPEMSGGNLNGWPVGVTNNVPNNLGGGTRGGSELYLVDMADVVLGDRKQVQFAVSDSASFVDSTGTTVSAFDNDLLVIRAIARHDLIVRHDTSIAIKTTVPYTSA